MPVAKCQPIFRIRCVNNFSTLFNQCHMRFTDWFLVARSRNALKLRDRAFQPWCRVVDCRTDNSADERPVKIRSSPKFQYSDVMMGQVTFQITCASIACSTICSSADQRKHQSSASLAFVWGIHRWTGNSPHKRPITRKCFHLMTSSG